MYVRDLAILEHLLQKYYKKDFARLSSSSFYKIK